MSVQTASGMVDGRPRQREGEHSLLLSRVAREGGIDFVSCVYNWFAVLSPVIEVPVEC